MVLYKILCYGEVVDLIFNVVVWELMVVGFFGMKYLILYILVMGVFVYYMEIYLFQQWEGGGCYLFILWKFG